MTRAAILGLLLSTAAWRAAADSPLPAPADYKAQSPNGSCYALLEVKSARTTVFRRAKGRPAVRLWDMAGWFRVVSLSDDCEHLVVGYDGSNLLPLDFTPDLVMLRFFERGRLLREVRLNELIRDRSKLQRTVSHYNWGRYLGFDQRNRYLVETVEGERIVFSATGQRVAAGGK